MEKQLSRFGYAFNADGELRHTRTKHRFPFETADDNVIKLACEATSQKVMSMYVDKHHLESHTVPRHADTDEPQSRILLSPHALEKKKLLVLVSGKGESLPPLGFWSMPLAINGSLASGAMVAYVDQALSEDYGVMLMNPNGNEAVTSLEVNLDDMEEDEIEMLGLQSVPQGGSSSGGSSGAPHTAVIHMNAPVRDSETHEQHVLSVWDDFIQESACEDVYFIAHSYGGVSVLGIGQHRPKDFVQKVRRIAFLDSCHGDFEVRRLNDDVVGHLDRCSKNWVRSELPLDVPCEATWRGCREVSAGHVFHDSVCISAIHSVFGWFNQ